MSTRWNSVSTGPGSSTVAIAVWISASLSGNTRKIVPSATPAASAICRVVTLTPCSATKGSVAATSAARRSAGGNGLARPITGGHLDASGETERDPAGLSMVRQPTE